MLNINKLNQILMKTLIKIFTIGAIFSYSCSSDENISDAYGNFEAEKTIISAEGSGKLLTFNIEEGDELKADQLIGQIDTMNLYFKKEQLEAQASTLRSNFTSIDAQLEVSGQQISNLKIEVARFEKLLASKAATQKQYDDITGQLKVAEKQLDAQKTQRLSVENQLKTIDAQLGELNLNISKCVVKNPVNGTVLSKLANTNEMVALGKPLYYIADLKNIKLKVYVTGDQLPSVIIGKEVEVVADAGKGEIKKLKGKVVWISETSEFTPKTVQTKEVRANLVYAVKILVANDGSLKIGMPGEVNF